MLLNGDGRAGRPTLELADDTPGGRISGQAVGSRLHREGQLVTVDVACDRGSMTCRR